MNDARRESGFALILAILALMLLTFLGLTLATTTSTELQIASNYRNAQQAFYNAEAGIEVGKRVLRNFTSWGALLPAPRGVAGVATGYGINNPPLWGNARVGASGEASRNNENMGCDAWGGEGYGVVLDPLNTAFPYQNIFQYQGAANALQGTFTIWVRREVIFDPASGLPKDQDKNEALILTAEGTAPYTVAGTAYSQRNRAVRVLEAYVDLQAWKCEQGNQEGNSGEGNGAYTCGLTTGG